MCKNCFLLSRGKLGIIFLLTLCCNCLQSQNKITGKVLDDNLQPINGAMIISSSVEDSSILAFAISNNDGNYAIELSEGLDSIWLKITHISHATQEKKVTNQTNNLDWHLRTASYKLPELVVKVPPVRRIGDTLIFDVNQLRTVRDENLEQLLARIPGITVEASGRILYQDLPISKFYIEGLDLLEGSYALATRNLNLDAIRDIEILEKHQPIRALDSLIVPPNAAINLRLKSSIAFVGEVEGATGFNPALYKANAKTFGFQKQQQFNLIGGLNNIGEKLRDDFNDLTSGLSFSMPIVNPTIPFQPFGIPNKNANDNKEYAGGLNYLRKINETSQIKIQALVAKDNTQLFSQNILSLRDQNTLVIFNNQLRSKNELENVKGRLIYEVNKKMNYTKLLLSIENNQKSTIANNTINGSISNEDFIINKLELKGRLQNIIRKNNKAFRFWSRFDYVEDEYNLALNPLDVLVRELPVTTLTNTNQYVKNKKLTSDIYTSFIARFKEIVVRYKPGIESKWRQIDSDLLMIDTTDTSASLGQLFINNMNQKVWSPYFNQDYQWKNSKHQWELDVPLSLQFLNLEDPLRSELNLKEKILIINPELSYRRIFSSARQLWINTSFNRSLNENQLYYNGYILTSNRNFNQQPFFINRKNTFEIKLGYSNNNINQGLYHSNSISISQTKADLINTTVFDSLGQSSILASSENRQTRFSWNSKLDIVTNSPLSINFNSEYSFFVRPNNINGSRFKINVHQLRIKSNLSYTFEKTVISLKPELNFYNTNIAENLVQQMDLAMELYHELPKNWGNILVNFSPYLTKIGSRNTFNKLLNLRYKNKIPRLKLEISVHLNNLTGEENFTTFTQGIFSDELSFFRLRQRQIIFKMGRKF